MSTKVELITCYISLKYKKNYMSIISGDDCVNSNEYVEDDRVGKIYGQTLINNVRDTIQKSGCKISNSGI